MKQKINCEDSPMCWSSRESTFKCLSHDFTNSVFIGMSLQADACVIFPCYQPDAVEPWTQIHGVVLMQLKDLAFRRFYLLRLSVALTEGRSLSPATGLIPASWEQQHRLPHANTQWYRFPEDTFLVAEDDTIHHCLENKLLWEAKPMLAVLLLSLSNCHQHPNSFLLRCLLHMFSKVTTETGSLLQYQHKILLKATSYCFMN